MWDSLTKCVHCGGWRDETVGAVTTPIYTSSSYRINGEAALIRYPRYCNLPTQIAVAGQLAGLENGEAALAVSSGMAAITTTVLALVSSGDHVIVQHDVYGGTFHFATSELRRFGIDISLVRSQAVEDFEKELRNNTRLILFETPTNPLLKIVDIRQMVHMAVSHGLTTVMDNTLASPINQTPLDLGVDVVVHSGTKYLGGHSDLCCGAIVTSHTLMERIRDTAINLGVALGPWECAQLERSIKTLGLRVRQHNAGGRAVAEFLAGHPRVKNVHFPGLADHPGHGTAVRQMTGFGGMVSFEPHGDAATARRFVDALQLFTHAVSLGGVESLVCFPAQTSHAKLSAEERLKIGVTDTLIRLSVGIEDTSDLIKDLAHGLSAST
jgi:cystathionine beta-lyase